ncbi:hypothetical protein ACTFIU_001144 [Dictyostelium citrinum]
MIAQPPSILTLNIDDKFNQPIVVGDLQQSITSLSLGFEFNQSIAPGALPDNLRSLSLGRNFNQTITPGVLPNNLKTLTILNPEFNQDLITEGSIPPSLERIYCVSENKDFINNPGLSKFIQIIK